MPSRWNKYIGDKAFYRRLFAVMLPVLLQNVITNFVSLLDNVMVGRVGTEQMSGVAIVNQLLFVFNLCIFGGLAGAGIFTAQFHGKGDPKGVRDTMRLKLFIAAASVVLFLVIFLTAGGPLIRLFLHEGEEALDLEATFQCGKDYLAVMLWQMAPFALGQIYASTLRETGETALPMTAGVVATLVNLCLNYLLIFGKFGFPALGVVGAAIATVIARFVEMLIVVGWTHLHKKRCPYIAGVWRTLQVPMALTRKTVIMGAPLLANEVLWSGGMAVLNQCYSLRGLEVVSAFNISTTASNLFFCSFLAMGTTVSIIVGQHLGAGDLERAVDEDRKLIAFAVVMSVGVGIVMYAVSPAIPLLYNTTDAVRALAVRLLRVAAIMVPINAYINSAYFTLRSGGKTIITFLFDSCYVWVISIPAAFLLSRFTAMPVVEMYFVVEGLNLIKVVIGALMLRSRRWVNNLVEQH